MDALSRESKHENWGVKTLTVFPHVTRTSKEVMDTARKMVPYVTYICQKMSVQFDSYFFFSFRLSTLERIGMQTPVEVAKETVRAMRSDDGYIAIPRYYLFLGRVYQ